MIIKNIIVMRSTVYIAINRTRTTTHFMVVIGNVITINSHDDKAGIDAHGNISFLKTSLLSSLPQR